MLVHWKQSNVSQEMDALLTLLPQKWGTGACMVFRRLSLCSRSVSEKDMFEFNSVCHELNLNICYKNVNFINKSNCFSK